ncbi:hypothetical protein [Methanobrevibacter sp.]|uniref:hypothetical protein n=1 Tax=Methanobrevibacter sp. TaxID=66852 RepID=UPI0038640FB6
MSHILRHDWIKGGGNISKICLDIDEGLLEELRMQAVEIESDCRDLIVECIEKGLKGSENMSMVSLNDNVMEKVNIISKLTDRTPEEVVNDTLWDNLRKIEDVPVEFDGDKLWEMLDHDNPEGDDILDELSNVNQLMRD